jgi:hypothetical protein
MNITATQCSEQVAISFIISGAPDVTARTSDKTAYIPTRGEVWLRRSRPNDSWRAAHVALFGYERISHGRDGGTRGHTEHTLTYLVEQPEWLANLISALLANPHAHIEPGTNLSRAARPATPHQ